MKALKKLMVTLALVSIAPVLTAADNNGLDHPGYVDFSTLRSIASIEPNIEVSLKAPLLNMVTSLVRAEDDEAADFLSRLLRVTVNVFTSDSIDVNEISSSMDALSQDLDARGWERTVRVREDEEHVDVYFRLSEDAEVIYGIAVMVAEPDDTVLVNIVGDIRTEDIAALGRRFNIDELIEYDAN